MEPFVGDGDSEAVPSLDGVSLLVHHLASNLHLLIRCEHVVVFRHLHLDSHAIHVVFVDEEEPLCHHFPFRVIEGEDIDAGLQFVVTDSHLLTLLIPQVHDATLERAPPGSDVDTQLHSLGLVVPGDDGLPSIAYPRHVEHNPSPVGLGQREGVVLPLVVGLQFQPSCPFIVVLVTLVGGDSEHSPSGIVGLERAYLLAFPEDGAFDVERTAVSGVCLESHPCRNVTHHVATLGIEVDFQAVFRAGLHRSSDFRQHGNAPLLIMPFFHLFINGEHPAEDARISSQVVLEALSVELLGKDAGESVPVMAVSRCEIEHPCGICPHLVKSGVEGVLEVEGAIGLTVSHHQFLRLYGIANGVDQFDIEYPTEVGGLQRGVIHHESFVIDVLTFV